MNNNLIITEFLINNNEKPLMIKLKRGLLRWLASTNHKDIGTFDFMFGLFSGFVGRIFRLLIILDKRSNNSCLIFYFKGSMVIFITAYRLTIIIAIAYFFLAPFLMGGFGNWLLPLLLGCGDIAFSRLNKLSFWLLSSGLFLYIIRILVGHQGMGVDLRIFSIQIAGASRIGGLINFLWTIKNNCFFDFKELINSSFWFLLFIAGIGVFVYLLIIERNSGGGGGINGGPFKDPFNPNPKPPFEGCPPELREKISKSELKERLQERIEEEIRIEEEKRLKEAMEIGYSSSSDQSSKTGSKECLVDGNKTSSSKSKLKKRKCCVQ